MKSKKLSRKRIKQLNEARAKRTLFRSGHKNSLEQNQKISNSLKGHKVSLETREKLRQAKLGKKVSEETKLKLSKIHKGRKHTEQSRKNMSEGRKGIVFTEEHKKNLSLSHSGKPNLNCKGSKSHFWKGGISSLRELIRASISSSVWKKQVFFLDNFTCQLCKQRGGKLEADHIKPFALIFQEFLESNNQFSPITDKEFLLKLALDYDAFWDVDNGRTLCKPCHKEKTKQDWKLIKERN